MNAKIDLGKSLHRHSLTGGASSIAAVAAIAGYLWVDLEPRVKAAAKEQVEAILVAGDYAKGSDVKALNRNVEEAEQRIRKLERKQDTNNAKAEAERKAIKEKIDDTNELIRDVLRMRRRGN
jgi:DNA repair exonuclease SbcCD nuclease subunit